LVFAIADTIPSVTTKSLNGSLTNSTATHWGMAAATSKNIMNVRTKRAPEEGG
jgi:hypothetical protein